MSLRAAVLGHPIGHSKSPALHLAAYARLGADIGLRCTGCRRHVLLERPALERRLVAFVERGDPVLTAAVMPVVPDPGA